MQDVHDVIILGSGPVGPQAAVHAVPAKVTVLVLGKPLPHLSSLTFPEQRRSLSL
jgi:thioredoxin reductase